MAGAAGMASAKMGKFENRQKFEHNGQTVYEWEQSMEEVLIYIVPPPGVKARDIECKITVTHLTLGMKGNPPFLNHDTGGLVVIDESMWTLGACCAQRSLARSLAAACGGDVGTRAEGAGATALQWWQQLPPLPAALALACTMPCSSCTHTASGTSQSAPVCPNPSALPLTPSAAAARSPPTRATTASLPAANPPDEGEIEINLQKVKKGETWNSALAGHESLDPFTKGEVQKKMMLERFQEENPGFDFSGAEFSGSAPDPRKFMGGVKYT